MHYDDYHANEYAGRLLDLIEDLKGKRATDEQLEEASILCEESNRFVVEWGATAEGFNAFAKFAEENEDAVEKQYGEGIDPVKVIEDKQGLLDSIMTVIADHNPKFDADLASKAMSAWKKFFLSHDHAKRLMKLAVVA